MQFKYLFKEESLLFFRLLIYIAVAVLLVNIYTYWPVTPIKVSAEDSQHLSTNIGTPDLLVVPSIGVKAKIEPVQKTSTGNLDVPKNLSSVGWYSLGTKPGDIGNAVMAGHEVDQFGLGVVFRHLNKLRIGDVIEVHDVDRKKVRFEVTRTEVYEYDKAPLSEIFGTSTSKNLNLITCNGNFVHKLGTKDMRLVVYSTRIEP
jgi:sortase A